MQGVGLERLAGEFVGGLLQRAGTGEIDDNRKDHDDKRPGVDRQIERLVEEEPLRRFVDDP